MQKKRLSNNLNSKKNQYDKNIFNIYNLYNKTENNFVASEDLLGKFFYKYDDENITDFHFEPNSNNVCVKTRYCGNLVDLNPMSLYEYDIFLNKLLINCGFDIIKDFENIDGSFSFENTNFRVSFVKSSLGISCVLRKLKNINDIRVEMDPIIISNIEKMMREKSKVLIFSGPTGSGKTTTMQYVVNKFKNKRKVHSIENPIEYINPDIIQVVSKDDGEKINILKYILRQDPDIIVVGEIREKMFAKLLFESAVTGHLVFSTIHTKNVFLIFQRLKMLGIEVKNISESLDFLLNQRLIPKKCVNCKGTGCEACYGTGKRGYLTIFEGLLVSNELKRDISLNKSISFIKEKYKNSENYLDPSIKLREFLDNNLINDEEYYVNFHSF
ncbi:MAG TPA: ATPase, T2SS/T4P/T4SS family [Defluviitoga sp.]|nr:ATPase, T2SS/T4P/T4SS family [Defluviitoga sp.]HOP24291.1 ATPase, T2SS/T4P/T4SS family [Defluviitoga sp.]HQD62007.1 ATPase, T2SS/T4P/T4SS family [Defluviitoga sp.]